MAVKMFETWPEYSFTTLSRYFSTLKLHNFSNVSFAFKKVLPGHEKSNNGTAK